MKIGEIIETKKELSFIKANKDTITYPKGTKVTITARGHMLLDDGRRANTPNDAIIEGYAIESIAIRVMQYLKRNTEIEDIIDDEEDYCNEQSFIEVIRDALEDILDI